MKNLIIFIMVSIIITSCGIFKPDDKINKLSAAEYKSIIQQANDIIYDNKSLAPIWYKNALKPSISIRKIRTENWALKADEITEIGFPSVTHTPYWLSLFFHIIASFILSASLSSFHHHKAKSVTSNNEIKDESSSKIGEMFVIFCLSSIIIMIFSTITIKTAYHFIYNTKGAYTPWEFCATIGLSIFSLIYVITALCLMKPVREMLSRWHEDYKNM